MCFPQCNYFKVNCDKFINKFNWLILIKAYSYIIQADRETAQTYLPY